MAGYLAPRFSTARLVGLGLVVLIHVVLIYALVQALAHRSIELLQQPIEANIIAVAPPPEPAKPPPPEKTAPPAVAVRLDAVNLSEEAAVRFFRDGDAK